MRTLTDQEVAELSAQDKRIYKIIQRQQDPEIKATLIAEISEHSALYEEQEDA